MSPVLYGKKGDKGTELREKEKYKSKTEFSHEHTALYTEILLSKYYYYCMKIKISSTNHGAISVKLFSAFLLKLKPDVKRETQNNTCERLGDLKFLPLLKSFYHVKARRNGTDVSLTNTRQH